MSCIRLAYLLLDTNRVSSKRHFLTPRPRASAGWLGPNLARKPVFHLVNGPRTCPDGQTTKARGGSHGPPKGAFGAPRAPSTPGHITVCWNASGRNQGADRVRFW